MSWSGIVVSYCGFQLESVLVLEVMLDELGDRAFGVRYSIDRCQLEKKVDQGLGGISRIIHWGLLSGLIMILK